MNTSHPVSVGGILTALALAMLAGCGGGGGSSGGSSTPPPATTYTIGGSVTGLTGTGLVLQDNGGDNLAVSKDGSFTFAKAVSSGGAYAVTVATQPAGQTCTVSNGSGTATANVTNVTVTCAAGGFTIGGTVTGLAGSGLVLQDNSGDDLPVSANGAFTFKTSVASGGAYAVTVKTQPSSPAQTCTVAGGTGKASANVTTVTITCAAAIGKFAYTANSGSGNITAFQIDPNSGALTPSTGTLATSLVADGTKPAAVSLAPNGKWAFSASDNGTKINAFTIDQSTGALTKVSGSPFSTGFTKGSTYPDIAVDPTSHYLYLASAGEGKLAGFSIDQSTGVLTAIPGTPIAAGANAGAIPAFSPNGKFVYVMNQADGVANGSVSGYSIGANGALTAIPGSPFAAGITPNWIAFTPDGKFAYVSNGGNNSGGSSIYCYSVNSSGALTQLTGAIGSTATETNPQDITIDATGTHLYVPGKGNNRLGAFVINADGSLTKTTAGNDVPTGVGPMFFNLHPSGKFGYVASSGGADIYAYMVDAATGGLTPMATPKFAAGTNPIFFIMDPSGKFGYAANSGSNSISGYTIDPNSGALTPIPGSPFPTGGTTPFVVSVSPEAPGIRD